MTPIPKRGAGGRFVAGGGRIAKSPPKKNRRKKNAAELIIFNPRKKKGRIRAALKVLKRGIRTFKSPAQQRREEIEESQRSPDSDYHRRKNKRRRKKLNPDEMQEAITLYEKFHGADPSKILEVQESAAVRSTYAGLGDLVELLVKRGDGRVVQMQFEGDKIKVAANPKGTQIYFIGGNQNLNGALGEFDADTTKDFVELGECTRIMYFTHKEADGFQPVDYHHKFGEEGGARPMLIYNKIQRRMILAGGSYTVEAPGIIN